MYCFWDLRHEEFQEIKFSLFRRKKKQFLKEIIKVFTRNFLYDFFDTKNSELKARVIVPKTLGFSSYS